MKKSISRFNILIPVAAVLCLCVCICGCIHGGLAGYSNEWPHPKDVSSVYVEMFDTQNFRRGHEYVLTDAICKRIESETPYKIVSDRDQADTLLSGQVAVTSGVLTGERYTGMPLEKEALVTVSVSWKNLKTGELLIENKSVSTSASYSEQLSQTFDYASKAAVNRAAQKVVELMENPW